MICHRTEAEISEVKKASYCHCWWIRDPANQLRLVVFPSICKVHSRFYTSQVVCLRFLPSTVPPITSADLSTKMFHKIHINSSSNFAEKVEVHSWAVTPASRCNSPNSIHWRLVCAIHPSIHLQHELGRTNRKRQLSLNVKSNLGTKNRLLEGNSW